MTTINCDNSSCKFNKEGRCHAGMITIKVIGDPKCQDEEYS